MLPCDWLCFRETSCYLNPLPRVAPRRQAERNLQPTKPGGHYSQGQAKAPELSLNAGCRVNERAASRRPALSGHKLRVTKSRHQPSGETHREAGRPAWLTVPVFSSGL